jgi:hypothetical protein
MTFCLDAWKNDNTSKVSGEALKKKSLGCKKLILG